MAHSDAHWLAFILKPESQYFRCLLLARVSLTQLDDVSVSSWYKRWLSGVLRLWATFRPLGTEKPNSPVSTRTRPTQTDPFRPVLTVVSAATNCFFQSCAANGPGWRTGGSARYINTELTVTFPPVVRHSSQVLRLLSVDVTGKKKNYGVPLEPSPVLWHGEVTGRDGHTHTHT